MEISEDEMCDTYEEWLKGAEDSLLHATRRGTVIHRITIRPEEFLAWAKLKRKRLDSYARIEFASSTFAFVKHLSKPYVPPKQMPDRKVVYKAMRAYKASGGSVDEIWEPFLRRPKASVCPLLRSTSNGPTEQFGSGVLVRIGKYHFLFSVAHVLDELERDGVLIPGIGTFFHLSGQCGRTGLPGSGLRIDDRIDLAFFELNAETVKQLHQSLVFLNESDCDPLDMTETADVYTAIGYPAHKSDSGSDGVSTRLTSFSGDGVNDHRYRALGISKHSHLLMQYRHKKAIHYTTLNQGGSHDVSGVSGGGIFAWDKALPDPSALKQPKLVALVTEYHPNHHVFVGTRLSVLLSALHKHYPDLPFTYVPHPAD